MQNNPTPTAPMTPATSASPTPNSAASEHTHHDYRTSRIPWYVHVIWIGFWILAVIYILRNLVPAMKIELFNPP